MKNKIAPLFPTPIGLYDLEQPLTESEKSFIVNLEQGANMGNTSSVDRYLLRHKKLSRLKEFFYESVNHYFKEIYQPMYDVKLRITQCWANWCTKGQWHHKHAHPNSFISGVFYANSDQDKDRIYFYPSILYKQIDIPHHADNWNMFNTDSWWFPAVENQLILFPSGLQHSVDAIDTDRQRVSVSLNTFPVGVVGDFHTLTECILEDNTKKGKK